MLYRWLHHFFRKVAYESFCVFSGPNYDKIVITHNNEVLGKFDLDESYKAFALQYGSLYLYDASYEVDFANKKLPDNIRYVFQFLSVYVMDIRIKEVSGGLKRINAKVKELMELAKKYAEKQKKEVGVHFIASLSSNRWFFSTIRLKIDRRN